MTTKHSCNNGNGPAFGRKTAECPRCDELIAGAAPVSWGGSYGNNASYKAQLNRVYTHTCSAKCGPVCTADQW